MNDRLCIRKPWRQPGLPSRARHTAITMGSNMSEYLADAMCQPCQGSLSVQSKSSTAMGYSTRSNALYVYHAPDSCVSLKASSPASMTSKCCRFCGKFLTGHMIKAMRLVDWHPGCFHCELFCGARWPELCEFCKDTSGCLATIHLAIDEQLLIYKNGAYHLDHFSCFHWGRSWPSNPRAESWRGSSACLVMMILNKQICKCRITTPLKIDFNKYYHLHKPVREVFLFG